MPSHTDLNTFLEPTSIIDSDNTLIREQARSLVRGKTSPADQAVSLFYFVRDEISYNLYVSRSLPEHFKASNTLTRGEGYCVQKAVLLSALARATGIPSSLSFARIKNNLIPTHTLQQLGSNIFPFHGYTELFIDGKWVKATPAFDIRLCRKLDLIPVEFDGYHDAMFPPNNREGKRHIEYLQDLGRNYHDVPLETLQKTLLEHFGDWALEPSILKTRPRPPGDNTTGRES